MGRTCCTCDGDKEIEIVDEGKLRMIDMSSNTMMKRTVHSNAEEAFMK